MNLNDYIVLKKSELTYAQDLLYTFHNTDFLNDPLFIESYNLGKATHESYPYSTEIYWRIHVLCWAADYAKSLPGDFIDCGVDTGFFARAIVNFTDFNTLNKKYYLLDTFQGMDERYCGPKDIERNEWLHYKDHKDLHQKVIHTFKDFNVKVIKGPVPDTLSQVDTDSISFLSLDMNCALPEYEALKFLWDKIVPGGIVVMDDYAYRGCEDQKQILDKFAAEVNTKILSLPTCQGLLIKTQ
ncbi:TylF/MycF/NovP-related O-methyltransferase [Paradesertivirga mongoliensis]|uniref:TylF/MycF/NovP-related O-methyltransferase n=1 Tax=Paradesertivirga mongoliensis TaxID=2100740 RepID=A0ABW4ZHE6_9SPHI|nr:TylF/MycF/NovP-related O-methyltransferase [Pedobacter mongoliensis]